MKFRCIHCVQLVSTVNVNHRYSFVTDIFSRLRPNVEHSGQDYPLQLNWFAQACVLYSALLSQGGVRNQTRLRMVTFAVHTVHFLCRPIMSPTPFWCRRRLSTSVNKRLLGRFCDSIVKCSLVLNLFIGKAYQQGNWEWRFDGNSADLPFTNDENCSIPNCRKCQEKSDMHNRSVVGDGNWFPVKMNMISVA